MKFTQEQISNRTSDYVCFDCGSEFVSGNKQKETVVTAHFSTCGLCQKPSVAVTHIRAFNYLLLPRQSLIHLEPNCEMIIWSTKDFENRAIDKCDGSFEIAEKRYNFSKFPAVLKDMIEHHDSEYGINLNTIDYYLEEYCLIK